MYDTNNDGYIDFKEFMTVLYTLSKGTPEQNLEQIFRVFDIDNDQKITKDEMKKIVKTLMTLMSAKEKSELADIYVSDYAFAEMDLDKDGSVTKEEFVRACMNHEKISTLMAMKIIDIFISDGDDDEDYH